MPLKLIAPIYKTFELTVSDKKYNEAGEPPTEVLVKQAAQHEHERRQQLFSTLERKFSEVDPSQVSFVQTISQEEIKRMEVWLTLCSCNILDEHSKALFPSKKNKAGFEYLNMSQAEFNLAWGKLPPDVANEIHDKVREVNFMWSDRGEV